MKIAVQVPIKARASQRVPNKNWRDLCGKPLCHWMLDELSDPRFKDWRIYIDSESDETWSRLAPRYGSSFWFHQRKPWYASDAANGNHLLQQFAHAIEADIYVQAFVTAVTLPADVIYGAVSGLELALDQYDSALLATRRTGWFWNNDGPINYQHRRPDGLPRSQDAQLWQETTGLYAITRDALLLNGCRVGAAPMLVECRPEHAIDIDTIDDLDAAAAILGRRRAGETIAS